MKGFIITFLAILLCSQFTTAQQIEDYQVHNIAINDNSDMAGVSFFRQNYIIYTLPKKEKNIHDTDFYVSMASENGTVLDGQLLEGNLNSFINEVNLTFTTDFKKVYFTRSYIDNYKKEHFDIYIADVTEENKFINIKALPINYKNYSSAYPSLSADNKTLYFASNRRESLGGFDIFKVAIMENGKRFGKVINLGKNVNTKMDEITPYVLGDRLFYSSEGKGGFGEFDVFTINLDLKEEATNLGEHLNSKGDDFGYIRKIHRDFGYFVSDRSSGKGNNDIYYFKVIKIDPPVVEAVQNIPEPKTSNEEKEELIVSTSKDEVKGNLTSDKEKTLDTSKDKNTIINDKIQIAKNKTAKGLKQTETQKQIDTIQTTNSSIEIAQNTVIKDTKKEEEQVKEPVYVEEIIYSEEKELAENVYAFQRRIAYNTKLVETGRILKKRKEFTRLEKKCADRIEKLNDIYFDLNKFNIRPDAQIQVNKAIKIMEKCPNVNFVASSFTDSRGSSEYNRKLSQRRADSVVNYILTNSTISEDRIKGVGYGESGLKNKCYNGVKCSEKQHQVNRRTEIEVYIYK